MNIELSSVLEKDGRMVDWAHRVYNRMELSEEDVEISSAVEGFIKDIDKKNSSSAREALSELIIKVVEPQVFNAPYELLDELFATSSTGEFDKVTIYNSPKNTLVARESAARTGNVKKSYIDFTKGNVVEKHLQIETEIRMSDLRRQGAFGVAQLIQFAIEEFQAKKFAMILAHVDSLIVNGGDNYVECAGELTQEGLEDLNAYVDDNCFEGQPVIAGLSSVLRPIATFAGYEKSEATKEYFNNASVATRFRDSAIVSVKAGKKMGNGEALLPKNRLYGFAGKIGEMYTKGEMRNLTETNINDETIHIKLTGVEFGFCITDLTKVAKLAIA